MDEIGAMFFVFIVWVPFAILAKVGLGLEGDELLGAAVVGLVGIVWATLEFVPRSNTRRHCPKHCKHSKETKLAEDLFDTLSRGNFDGW